MGVEFEDVGSHGIGNNHTWHIVKSLTGSGQGVLLMKTMAERAKQLGVRIFLKTPVKKILKTGGRVTGVIAEDEKGETIQVDAKAVISAAGGWGGDYPDLPTVSGDGINMAREAGAHVTEKRYPVVRRKPMPPPRKGGGGSFGPTMMTVAEAFEQPNLMVNLMGERFTNEEIMAPNLFWRNVLFMQKDRCGFMIFDEDTKNYYVKNGYDIIAGFTIGNMKPVFLPTEFDKCMNEITESGSDILFVFDSLEEMASKLEINPDRLRATVTEYNHFCETGIDGAFNKNPRYLRPVKNPKFYVRKSMAQSPTGDWEGIRINHKTEVIAEDFTVIPGFYAAGTDAACNVFHGTYPNILPGNNMGFAINSGRIAGENAAAYSKSLDSKK
jgi:fumarate reductase flavoprotein subunit